MPSIKKVNNNENDTSAQEVSPNNMETIESLQNKINELTQLISLLNNNKPKNDDVMITSLYNGVLNLYNGVTYIVFNRFGDTRAIPRDSISNCINYNISFFEKGFFYVNDEDIVRQYGYTDFYKTLLTETVIRNIQNYKDEDIKSLVSNAPTSQQEILCEILAEKYNSGEISDVNKLNFIDTCCGNKIGSICKRAEDIKLSNKK